MEYSDNELLQMIEENTDCLDNINARVEGIETMLQEQYSVVSGSALYYHQQTYEKIESMSLMFVMVCVVVVTYIIRRWSKGV